MKIKDTFQKFTDQVSFLMGTPTNIAIWFFAVLGWTLYSAHTIGAGWLTSQSYNFPLNLITTVAELFIGFLVGASGNRSERNIEALLSKIEEIEEGLQSDVAEDTKITKEVHEITSAIHAHLLEKGKVKKG